MTLLLIISGCPGGLGVQAKVIVPVEEMEPGAMIGQNQMGFVGHEGMDL